MTGTPAGRPADPATVSATVSATAAPTPAPVPATHPPLAELEDVSKVFSGTRLFGRHGAGVQALSGVGIVVPEGTTVGVVGESGCGKSTLGRLLVGLERPTTGAVRLRGTDVATMSRAERKAARHDVQMVFQDPFAALNPRMTLRAIIEEPLRARGGMARGERRRRVVTLAQEVGLAPAQLARYPHELSGGQRQRVGLARALATNPALVVADEPVSALDVSVRSQILNLMVELQRQHQLTYLMISHDLAVVEWMADHLVVMYLGKVVESGTPEELFQRPAHHYTRALIDAVPTPDPEGAPRRARISGELPSALDPPSGCRFRTRCPAAQERCATEEPVLRSFGGAQQAACHFPLVPPRREHRSQDRQEVPG